MHLARQADGGDGGQLARRARAQIRHGGLDRLPPRGGILLGPQRLRALDVQLSARRRDQLLRGVHKDDLQLGRSEINAE